MLKASSLVGTLNGDNNMLARAGARKTLSILTRMVLELRTPDPKDVDPKLTACAKRVEELLNSACDDIHHTLLTLGN